MWLSSPCPLRSGVIIKLTVFYLCVRSSTCASSMSAVAQAGFLWRPSIKPEVPYQACNQSKQVVLIEMKYLDLWYGRFPEDLKAVGLNVNKTQGDTESIYFKMEIWPLILTVVYLVEQGEEWFWWRSSQGLVIGAILDVIGLAIKCYQCSSTEDQRQPTGVWSEDQYTQNR